MAVDNLKIQQEINKLIASRQTTLVAETQELQKQAAIAGQLGEAVKEVAETANKLDKFDELGKSLKDASREARVFGQASRENLGITDELLTKNTTKTETFTSGLTKGASKFSKLGLVGAAALEGLTSGFKFSTNLVSSLISLTTSLVQGLWSVGMAILSIPFKIMQGLVDMAQSGGGSNELARAFEELRGEFGSFKEAVSRDVIGSMHDTQGALAETGLTGFRVFGWLAESLKHFTELAKEMGSTWQVVNGMSKIGVQRMAAYQKALGLTGEDMKVYAREAMGAGRDVNDVFLEQAKLTTEMAEHFDMSQKVISKDMAKMSKDIDKFGNITKKQMAAAAAYTYKLNIEVENLGGVLDKYDNFDTAAEGVAEFARVFGGSVDIYALTNAETGAERLEMFRKALFDLGQDANTMSRVKLKLLGKMVGETDLNIVKAMFSAKQAGVAYKDFADGAEEASKKSMTQAEAMVELSDSIKRIIRDGQMMKGGFFHMFIQGMSKGLKMSRGFWSLMMNIRRSLRMTWAEGFKLGRALPMIFKPLGNLFTSLSNFFAPGNFQTIFGGLSQAIQGFLKDMSGGVDPQKAIAALFKKMHDSFIDFATGSRGPLGDVAVAFFDIGLVFFRALGGLAPFLIRGMTTALVKLAEFIRNPSKVLAALDKAGKVGDGPKAALINALQEAWVGIAEAWPALFKALKDLFSLVWKPLKAWGKEEGPKALKKVALVMFGPAVISMMLKVVIVQVGAFFATALPKIFKKGFTTLVANVGKQAVMTGAKLFGALAGVTAIFAAGVAINDGMKQYSTIVEDELRQTFGGKSVLAGKAGGAGAGIIDALTLGLVPDNIMEKIAIELGKVQVALFDAMEQEFGPGFRSQLEDLLKTSLDTFASIGELVNAVIEGDEDKITEQLIDAWFKMGEMSAKALGFALLRVLPALIVKLASFAFTIAGALLGVLIKAFDKIKGAPVFGIVGEAISVALKAVKGIIKGFKTFWEGVYKWLTGKSDPFKAFSIAVSEFFEIFEDAWTDAVNWAKKKIKILTKVVTLGFDNMSKLVKKIWSALAKASDKPTNEIMDNFKRAGEFISTQMGKAYDDTVTKWDKIKAWVSGLVDSMIANFKRAKDAITNALGKAWDTVKDLWKSSIETIKAEVVEPVKEEFTKVKTWIMDTVGNVWDAIIAEWKKITPKLRNAFIGIMKNMWEPFYYIFKASQEFLPKELWKTVEIINKQFDNHSPSKVMEKIGNNIYEGFKIGVAPIGGAITPYAKAMGGSLVEESVKLKQQLELNRARVIDLKSKIASIGTGGIMGSDGKITVKRPDHTIIINLGVTMDAGNVENVMINRQGSKIVTQERAFG